VYEGGSSRSARRSREAVSVGTVAQVDTKSGRAELLDTVGVVDGAEEEEEEQAKWLWAR
jgi:hypothetical protein